jgi:hypothetical protein
LQLALPWRLHEIPNLVRNVCNRCAERNSRDRGATATDADANTGSVTASLNSPATVDRTTSGNTADHDRR